MNTVFTENFNEINNFNKISDKNFLYNTYKFKNFYLQTLIQNFKGWRSLNNSVSSENFFYISKNAQKHTYIFDSNETFYNLNVNSNNFFFTDLNKVTKKLNYSNIDMQSRFLKRNLGTNIPFRIMKTTLNVFEGEKFNFSNKQLFNLNFNDGNSRFTSKCSNDIFLYTIKQLKYKRRTSLPIFSKFKKNNETGKNELVFKGRSLLLNNNIFSELFKNPESIYKLNQKNRNHTEQMPVSLTKRLLRTRRTLVLPAHMNITLITNSFDVVHS